MVVALPSWEHVSIFLAGSTALGIVAHAVNTFPTPENKYGQWFLGCVKFAVGQRVSAAAAIKGSDTVTVEVPRGTGAGLTKHAEQSQRSIDVVPGAVIVTDEKNAKTETVLPSTTPPKEGG